MAYLGITQVRAVVPGAALGAYQALASFGVQFSLIYPTFTLNSADLQTEIRIMEALGAAVAQVEGPNEPNIVGVSFNGVGGITGAVALQQALYAGVKSSTILNTGTHQTAVLQFSLSPGAIFSQYGDLAAWSDANNVHAYVRYGAPPYYGLQNEVDAATQYMPDLPTEITETGEPTLLSNENGVDETVQAIWDIDTLLEAFSSGIEKTFLYALSGPGCRRPAGHKTRRSLRPVSQRRNAETSRRRASQPDNDPPRRRSGLGQLHARRAGLRGDRPAVLRLSDPDAEVGRHVRSRALVRTTSLGLGDEDGEDGRLDAGFGRLHAELCGHQRLRRDAGNDADRVLQERQPDFAAARRRSAHHRDRANRSRDAADRHARRGRRLVDLRSRPWYRPEADPDTLTVSAAATVLGAGGNLTRDADRPGASVKGGAGALSVKDQVGGNTIIGGTGAFGITATSGNDTITTGMSGQNVVTLGSGEDRVIARGASTISGGSGSAGVTLAASGSRVVGGSGSLLVGDQVGGNTITGGTGAFAITAGFRQ